MLFPFPLAARVSKPFRAETCPPAVYSGTSSRRSTAVTPDSQVWPGRFRGPAEESVRVIDTSEEAVGNRPLFRLLRATCARRRREAGPIYARDEARSTMSPGSR